MSTIFGKWNLDEQPVDSEILASLSSTLNYWNADDQGIWIDQSIGLGHLMLYNTPESSSEKLPSFDEVLNLSITADARIDNRQNLFEQLGIPDPLHSKIADSQLILKAYDKWGTDCPKYLYGAFAFAIWDANKQHLFCARDQMGIRPFYFHHESSYFAFASEIKGLLTIPGLSRSIDKTHLIDLLANVFKSDGRTFYESIKSLLPAHCMVLDENGLQTTKYWTLDPSKNIELGSDNEYVEVFKKKFQDAVGCRVRSNYPIASQLSGGLDSSGVCAIAFKETQKNGLGLYTYSNTLPEGGSEYYPQRDEYKQVKDVLAFTGITENHKIAQSHVDYIEEISETLSAIGHPDWNHNFVNVDRISAQATHQGSRTLLSGFPGDEMVTSGCIGHLNLYFAQFKWKLLWKELKSRKVKRPYLSFLSIGFATIAHKLFGGDLLLSSEIIDRRIKKSMIKKKLLKGWRSYYIKQNRHPRFRPSFSRKVQANQILSAVVVKRFESEYLAAKQHRIETAYPLADVRLLEFVLALPLDQKVKLGVDEGRWLFRRAMHDTLPDNIIYQLKKECHTNVIPYETNHRLEVFDDVKEILNAASRSQHFNYLDFEWINEAWEKLNVKNSGPTSSESVGMALSLIEFVKQHPSSDVQIHDILKNAQMS